MNHVRNVLTDLVERRLWPVAVALLVAIVAAPVVLGGGSDSADVETAAVAPAPSGAKPPTVPGVTAVVAENGAVPTGKVKDPFVQQHLAKPQTSAGDAPAATVTPVGPAAPVPGSTTPTGEQEKAESVSYSVDLDFGALGSQRTHERLPRLSPLPNADSPVALFLGVLTDGETAVFLLSSDTTVTGDGECRPSPEVCTTLHVKEGFTTFLDIVGEDGAIDQYQLDLIEVQGRKAKSARSARKARARVSKRGRTLLLRARRARPDVAGLPLRYDRGQGLLVVDRDADWENPVTAPPAPAVTAQGLAPGDPSQPVVAFSQRAAE